MTKRLWMPLVKPVLPYRWRRDNTYMELSVVKNDLTN